MRSHQQIISDGGGYQGCAAKIDPSDALLPARVRFWARRDSIPAEAWTAVVAADLTTLDELANAAAARKGLAPAEIAA